VRILGAFYLRLVGKPTDVYQYLEPLYNDYRKLRRRNADGGYSLAHVDEFIDELLTTEYSCDIALPRVPKFSQFPLVKHIVIILSCSILESLPFLDITLSTPISLSYFIVH
jgi:hypothetical protein